MSGKDAVVSPVDAAAAAGLGVAVAAVAAVLFRIAGVRSAKRSRGKAHVRSGRTRTLQSGGLVSPVAISPFAAPPSVSGVGL